MKTVANTTVLILVLSLSGCVTHTYNNKQSQIRIWEGIRILYKLNIQTEPPGAKVYIGDEYAGISPLCFTKEYSDVAVYQRGTQTYQQQVGFWDSRFNNFGSTNWNDDLIPVFGESAEEIQLYVSLFEPSHISIYKAAHDGVPVLHQLNWPDMSSSGWIEVYALKEGYKRKSYDHHIDASDPIIRNLFQGIHPDSDGRIKSDYTATNSILVFLEPEDTPSSVSFTQQQQQQQQTILINNEYSSKEETGSLFIESNVEGARIYVDGMFVGSSPSTLKLSQGLHTIEVKAQGKQIYKNDISVLAGATLTLRANL